MKQPTLSQWVEMVELMRMEGYETFLKGKGDGTVSIIVEEPLTIINTKEVLRN